MNSPERINDSSHISDLLPSALNTPDLTEDAKIKRAWYEVNGDRERTHTVGTFFNAENNTLTVYLDSTGILQDFIVNKALYLGRLHNCGIQVSDIAFRRSKYKRSLSSMPQQEISTTDSSTEPSTLSAEELEQINNETRDLPDGLRAALSKAAISIKRYMGEEDTSNK